MKYAANPKITLGAILTITCLLVVSAGALNGGTALTASAFDSLKTQATTLLSSTMVLSLAFISLVVGVWQLAHGKGWGVLGWVLGILVLALVGPALITTVSTSTRHPVSVETVVQVPVLLMYALK